MEPAAANLPKIKALLISTSPQSVLPTDAAALPDGRFDLRVAASATEAIREAGREPPDLLLAHYASPADLDALKAYRREDVATPAILLVPAEMDAVSVELLKLGVKDVLPLPLDPSAAQAVLEAAYQQRRALVADLTLRQELADARQALSKRPLALEILHGVGRSLSAVLDADRLLDHVIDVAMHLVMADEGSILVSEKPGEPLAIKAQRSTRHEPHSDDRLRMESGLARVAMQSGRPLLIADMAASSWAADTAASSEPRCYIHSLLNIPFRIGASQMGVLSVVNKGPGRPFGDEDLLALSVLIDYVSVALENAARYDDSQRKAATGVFRQTVAALSHYINNPLAALMAGVHSLTSSARAKGQAQRAPLELQTLQIIEQKAAEIAAVISVLQEVVVPTSTQYWREEQMIDIESDLRERLAEIRRAARSSGSLG